MGPADRVRGRIGHFSGDLRKGGSRTMSTKAAPLNSTNTDSARYASEGYCFFPDVLPASDVTAARQELDRAIANLPEKQRVMKDGVEQEVDARPEYMTEPHANNAFWLELCRHPRVLDCVQAV